MAEEVGSSGPVPPEPRFIHLAHDNTFLASFSNYMEEAAPGQSDYVVVAPGGTVKYPVSGKIKAITQTEKEARKVLLASITDYDMLIVHSMVGSWARIVPEASRHVQIVWSGFGGDYYGNSRSPDEGILGPRTASLRRETLPRPRFDQWVRKRFSQFINARALRVAARKTDFFSAPVSADLTVFRARFPAFRGEYIQLNYATVEELSPVGTTPTGDNVLVGNSASYANNHLEVFEKLAHAGCENRRVIVPLSYGRPRSYRDAVVAAGTKFFGSAFEPVLELLPLDEYKRLLASCAYVVMGHHRQQALGNIITALMGGAAIVLDPRNPVYNFLRQEGAHISSLSELPSIGPESLSLSEAEQTQNREVAKRLWSREVVIQNLRQLTLHAKEGSSKRA